MPTTDTADMEAIVANMTLVDWLDDLTVRFLLNLPPAELSSVPRLCFQVEEAQWFYEDFIRPANPALPSLNLRQFCLTLFQHCPLLSGFNAAQHVAAYEEFLAYKVRVPVRGAILMDDSMEKVLLVRGWKKGASWSFPRGKINKNEPDLDCAIREVYEETGYDVAAANLVDVNRQQDGQVKAIDVTMREQHMKLFVFRGVPLDTYFEPRTRKEISKIQWYNIKDLPGFKKQKGLAGQGSGEAQATKFYMVAPFLGHLKKFISLQKRNASASTQAPNTRNFLGAPDGYQTGVTDSDDGEAFHPAAHVGSMYGTNNRSADELKRLLSIGQAPALQHTEPACAEPSNDLLAMLQGGNTAHHVSMNFDPRTPFDQIDNPFPAQTPQTPQPQLPQHSQDRTADMLQYPQLGYSPQRLQQLQQPLRNSSLPMQGGFGGHVNEQYPQNYQNHVPPHMQQHMAHHEQQRQHSLPDYLSHQQRQPQQAQNPQQYPGLRPSSHQQMSLLQAFHSPTRSQPPMALGRPVSQGFPAIGRGPSVPEASKLPPPRLNAHSMNLLDAFKGSNGTKTTPNDQEKSSGQGSSSVHGQNGQRVDSNQQSALLDLFRKTADVEALPPHTQPVPIQRVSSPALSDTTITGPGSNANEITRTLLPKAKAKAPVPKPAQQTSAGLLSSNEHKAQFGRTQAPSKPRNQKASPKIKARPEQQVPQFSILQRPGSSAGKALMTPQSPLRFTAPDPNQSSFQPQVLKRPTSAEASDSEIASASVPEIQAQSSTHRTNSLLDLLNGRNAQPVVKTPEPPPAPQLQPERQTSQDFTLPVGNHQKQQHLLNLFTKTGSYPKLGGSPGTPISPFTLGTPASSKPREPSFSEQALERSRPRIVSAVSARSGASSGQQTPTEAKDFMLGYLNGVVQKEGRSTKM